MKSPLATVRSLETRVLAVFTALDVYSLPIDERKLVTRLKQTLIDARLDVRDYEFSDTRAEQLKHAKQAHERLGQVRLHILGLSEYNVFSAIDVAQITAELEQITDSLE